MSRNTSIALVLGAVLLIFGGVYAVFSVSPGQDEHQSDIPYRLYKTDVVPDIYSSNETELYWLDANTLVFKGFPAPGPQTDKELNETPVSMFIWKLGEKARKHQVDERWDGYFCLTKKGLQYQLREQNFDDGRIYAEYFEGPPGHEQYNIEELHPRKSGEPVSCQSNLYRGCDMICRNELSGHDWGPLKDNAGYVDFGLSDQSRDTITPLTIHMDNTSDVVKTAPIPLREISELEWHYVPFKNAYFTWEFTTANVGVQARWKASNCMPLWWVWGDGRTQRLCVPAGPWLGSTSFSPTKRGIFFYSYNADAQGGYILTDGMVHKVIKGIVVHNHASSPDGCKIAYIHAKNIYGKSPSVRVLDFCVTEQEF